MQNLIQYGSFLVAVGCKLDYDTETAQYDIAEYPKEPHKLQAVKAAITDIEKFLNTANYTDGSAAVALADFVDGNPNPLIGYQRRNILNALGIMRGDKFIAAVMMQTKVNRSWHTSAVPNTCTYFGELCTHRGVIVDPKKRGIRSTRSPEEYHTQSGSTIKREQLITPAIEAAYTLIPDSVLVSAKQTVIFEDIESGIAKLDPESLDKLIEKLTARKEEINANS